MQPPGPSYDEEVIERRPVEYEAEGAAMPQWSAASDEGFGRGVEVVPVFPRPGEALPDHQPQTWPAPQWQWPSTEQVHRGNGREGTNTTTWVDEGYQEVEELRGGPGVVEDEDDAMKEREEVELEGLYVITPQKRNEGGDEQRPAAHTALAGGEQREKAECGGGGHQHHQSDVNGGAPATVTVEELLLVDPLLMGIEF
jgi:hypothetical protein